MSATVVTVAGPRAAEAALLSWLGGGLAGGGPARIVVPSESLRRHVAATIVRSAGRPVVGVRVQTLWALALEIRERAGLARPRSEALFGVVVRRFARREPALRAVLEGLDDGFGTVLAAVRDLLDAGLEEVHAGALLELLERAGLPATGGERDRAAALVRTALATREGLRAWNGTLRADVLREARDALSSHPDLLTPPSPVMERGAGGVRILIHGFVDATGVVLDLLEAVVTAGATLLVDLPPDPARPERVESAFAGRLLGRVLLTPLAPLSMTGEGGSGGEFSLLEAADPEAEVRAVARRIRRLLDGGERPEGIAVVGRELASRTTAIRRHFAELGVPFSAHGAPGPLSAAGRELQAFLELLREGTAMRVERWLDLLGHGPDGPPLPPEALAALRQKLVGRGVVRLADALRTRIDSPGDVAWALSQARALLPLLAASVSDSPLSSHGEGGRGGEDLLDALGWKPDRPSRLAAETALATLAEEVDPDLPLDAVERRLLLEPLLDGLAREPLGGRGGGVQVLTAMEARGRTFEHLFVVGLVRGVFPRPVHDDPLLPDPLRAALGGLLPDLPVKAAGFGEERHLFAQLVASSPRVTLCWPREDGSGRALTVSPLVLRLAAARRLEPERAPHPLASAAGDDAPRTPAERSADAALHSGRAAFAGLFPLAVAAARRELAAPGDGVAAPATVARGRLAVLAELDPDRSTPDGARRARGLGPYFGFVGPVPAGDDPRRRELWITHLEDLAACPWQTFVRRLLAVAPGNDPLEAMPTLKGALLGDVVHRVLHRVTASGDGGWPSPERLAAWLDEAARSATTTRSLVLPGLARAAAALAAPYLEVARGRDWADGAPAGARPEAEGSVLVADPGGQPREVRFRADRLDRAGDLLVATDYKTGAPPPGRPDPLAWLERGEHLQAAAYALAADGRRGRYLYLRPELDDARREALADGADPALRRAFAEVVAELLGAWDAGAFFPRLVEVDDDLEPPRCRTCEVAAACLRRDSGARLRLRRWAATPPEREGEAEAAARRVFLRRAAGRPERVE